MRLYLIRHARPDIPSGICYGRTDVPVRPQEHATALSALLPSLPMRAPVFSSPLRRCRDLATLLSAALDSGQVIRDARLREMDFGTWEMRLWAEIPRAAIELWAANAHSYRPGLGDNVLDLAQRLRAFLDDVQRGEHDEVIIVCHAGVIRVLWALREHASPPDAARRAAQAARVIAHGSLTVIDY